MALVFSNSSSGFPNQGKELLCQKWNGKFRSEYSDRNMWTTSRGDSEYSGQKKPKRTFPFEFRNLWHNGKQPVALVLALTVPVGEKEIVLTEEVFESVTALLNGEKDARAEYGDQHDLYNHAAEISDEDVNEMEETVCVDTVALCTSRRGRQIRRPLRLDL